MSYVIGSIGPEGPQGPEGPAGESGVAIVGTDYPAQSLGEDGDTYLRSGNNLWTKSSGDMFRWADNNWFTLSGDGEIVTLDVSGTYRCIGCNDYITETADKMYAEFLITGLTSNADAFIGLVEYGFTNDGSSIKDLTTSNDKFWVSTGDNGGNNIIAKYGINDEDGTEIGQTHDGAVRIGILMDKATGNIWAKYNNSIDLGYIYIWDGFTDDTYWVDNDNVFWNGGAWESASNGDTTIVVTDHDSDWYDTFEPLKVKVAFTGSPSSITLKDSYGNTLSTASSPTSPVEMDITFSGDAEEDSSYNMYSLTMIGSLEGDEITLIEFYYDEDPTGWIGEGSPDEDDSPLATINNIVNNDYTFVFCTNSDSVTCEMITDEHHMTGRPEDYVPCDEYRWSTDSSNISSPYTSFPTIDDETDPYKYYEIRPWQSLFVDTDNEDREIMLPQKRGDGVNEYDLVEGMQVRIIDYKGNSSNNPIYVESVNTSIEGQGPDAYITIEEDYGILEMVYNEEEGWIQISYPRRIVTYPEELS